MHLPPELVDHVLSFLPVYQTNHVWCPDLPCSERTFRALSEDGVTVEFKLQRFSPSSEECGFYPATVFYYTYDFFIAFLRAYYPLLTSEHTLHHQPKKRQLKINRWALQMRTVCRFHGQTNKENSLHPDEMRSLVLRRLTSWKIQ